MKSENLNKFLGFDEKENPFFRKDENGNILFYPWSYPGEAFYVTPKQEKWILIWISFLLLVATGYIVALLYGDIIRQQNIITVSFGLQLQLALPFAYILSVFWLRKGKSLHVLPIEDRRRRGKILFSWLILAWLAYACLSLSFPFIVFDTFINAFMLYVLGTVWIRKGFFFASRGT